MVRVAMIASDFVPSIGGIQSHTLRLSQRLAARGADVLVVTRGYRGLRSEEHLHGVKVLRVGFGDAPQLVSTGSFMVAALGALWQRRAEVQVLHAHQLLSATSVALLARLMWGVPIVVNPHLSGADGDVMQLRRRSILGATRLEAARRYGDAFIAISVAVRDELRAAGIAEQSIVAIPNGIDADTFCPAKIAERGALRAKLQVKAGALVVYTGRLTRQKGVDVLLDAWSSIAANQPDAILAVVGDGDARNELEAQAMRLQLTHCVQFVGAVSDVTPWLRAADAFVLPSRAEGMSVALLEAMACALPVVATAVGGTPEVLVDGQTGRLVPPDDAIALARAVAEVLANPASLGVSAREHVIARFSLEHTVSQTLDLYRMLCSAALGGVSRQIRR